MKLFVIMLEFKLDNGCKGKTCLSFDFQVLKG
jgi:hypothetical protein